MLEHDGIDIFEGIDLTQNKLVTNVVYAIFGILQINILIINDIFAMVVMICR